jgi:phosphohistidine swiveling domain-containing protein
MSLPNRLRSIWTRSAVGAPWTMPLQQLHARHLAVAGAKALALGRMLRKGLPVPPGFVVTTAAFRRCVEPAPEWNVVQSALAGLDPSAPCDVRSLSKRIQDALQKLPIPLALERAIASSLDALPHVQHWAVRSSATMEDLPNASFAGQHDSFLNVPRAEIPNHVRQCWLSLFTDRAIQYRVLKGVSHALAAMAVIVQEMIPAETAGVLFTADPTDGDAGRIVIEGTHGLGDKLVSGQVNPDRVSLDKATLRVINRHSVNQTPCLDESLMRRLGELAHKVERLFGGPQDIEWAACGPDIYLLQARPVTGKQPVKTWEERQVWTNANSGEAAPDALTPMTHSLIMPFMQGLLDNFIGYLGFRIRADEMISLIAGRPYFNVNIGQALLRYAPGIRPEDVGDIFGGAHEPMLRKGHIQLRPEDLPRLQFHPRQVLRGMPPMLVTLFRFLVLKNLKDVHVTPKPGPLPSKAIEYLSDYALLEAIHAALPTEHTGRGPALRLMGIGAFSLVALSTLSKRWFGAEGPALAARLTAGLGTLDPAEAGRDLWRLAEFAARHTELRRAVEEETVFADFQRRLQVTKEGEPFLERWQAFLTRHGHHARNEIELMNPRWCETPNVVLGLVRGFLEAIVRDAPVPTVRLSDLAAQRATLERECLHRLRNPCNRIVFRWALDCARRGLAIKENVKSECVQCVTHVRFHLLELGRRLVRHGRCDDQNDVFFLTVGELQPHLLFGDGSGLRKIVAARRAEHARNQDLRPPPVVFGNGDPLTWQTESSLPSVQQLEGLPVSPGVVIGRARVILQTSSDDRVLPGEILVAPSTDPAWSLHFVTAAGVAIDLGGMLSHGSILAREYGLPAVTNLGSATRAIHTGDLVQVDGNRGLVTILGRNGPAETKNTIDQPV